jgi:hypothetical protein
MEPAGINRCLSAIPCVVGSGDVFADLAKTSGVLRHSGVAG